jgi:hypothetical protein
MDTQGELVVDRRLWTLAVVLLLAIGAGLVFRIQKALADRFPYADERLAVEPLEVHRSVALAVRFRVENRSTQPVADGWAVAVVRAGGEVRWAGALLLPELAPGEALELLRDLPGLRLEAGEELTLRAVRPGEPGILQEFAELRRRVAAQRHQEGLPAPPPPAPQEEVLRACTALRLECTRIGLILCPRGVREPVWDCERVAPLASGA